MGSRSVTSAMQTNVQLMEIQIKLVGALTQLQVHIADATSPAIAKVAVCSTSLHFRELPGSASIMKHAFLSLRHHQPASLGTLALQGAAHT